MVPDDGDNGDDDDVNDPVGHGISDEEMKVATAVLFSTFFCCGLVMLIFFSSFCIFSCIC